MRERLATDSSSFNHISVNKAVSNTIAAPRIYNPSLNGSKQEKAKGSSSGSLDDDGDEDVLVKKRVKRRPEQGLEGNHFRPGKMTAFTRVDKTRSLKQSAGVLPKSNIQPSSLHGLEQSS